MGKDPTLKGIEVEPKKLSMKVNTSQALKVTARYSDSSTRDVTAMSLFEANDHSMAETDATRLVKTLDLTGSVAVMVRYAGKVSVYSISIPLGAPVDALPPAKNFIDDLVFAKLREIGVPPSPVIDDATLLRRVTLDIAGRLPTIEETTAFLTEADPKRRDLAIDRLLSSPQYADFSANKWTALLKNKRENAADITANVTFHAWMRDRLLRRGRPTALRQASAERSGS